MNNNIHDIDVSICLAKSAQNMQLNSDSISLE